MLKSVLLVGAAMAMAAPAQAGGHLGSLGTSNPAGAANLSTGIVARVGVAAGAKAGTVDNTTAGIRARVGDAVGTGGGIRAGGIGTTVRTGVNAGLATSVRGLSSGAGLTGLGARGKLGVGLAGTVHGLGTGGRLLNARVGGAGIGNSIASVKVGTAGAGRLATVKVGT